MIPHKAFFFWCGNSMSFLRYMSIWSFHKLNPTFDIRVYWSPLTSSSNSTNYKQDYSNYTGPDYWPRLKDLPRVTLVEYQSEDSRFPSMNPVFKSDLARWEILPRDGGLYIDSDILFIKPLSLDLSAVDTGLCIFDDSRRREYAITIGFLASSIGNPFFTAVKVSASKGYNPGNYQSMGQDAIRSLIKTGVKNVMPARESLLIIQRRWGGHVHNFPRCLVYPVAWYEQDSLIKQHEISFDEKCRNSVGIHWFGGCPLASEMNNTFTEQNMRTETFLGKYLSEVLNS